MTRRKVPVENWQKFLNLGTCQSYEDRLMQICVVCVWLNLRMHLNSGNL